MKDTLKQAIIEQLGYEREDDQELIDTCRDITRGGIDAGFCGFTYYSDTCRFFDENRQAILEHALDAAEDFGETSFSSMVASFRCLDATPAEVDRFLIKDDEDDVSIQIKNALAWFVAEEFAREQLHLRGN